MNPVVLFTVGVVALFFSVWNGITFPILRGQIKMFLPTSQHKAATRRFWEVLIGYLTISAMTVTIGIGAYVFHDKIADGDYHYVIAMMALFITTNVLIAYLNYDDGAKMLAASVASTQTAR